MSTFAPKYYKDFKCIADRCAHSCCVGWRVELDEATSEKYKNAKGRYAEELRRYVREDGDGAFIPPMQGGRCPHLDECGLCRIICEKGEDYLSDICREHPRYYNIVGDRLEVGLGASCPVAAALILSSESSLQLEAIPDIEFERDECEYSPLPLRERIASLISGTECYEDAERLIMSELGLPRSITAPSFRASMLSELEYLYPENREIIFDTAERVGELGAAELLKVLAYFIYRHLSPAESESEAASIVGFAIFSARTVAAMAEVTSDLAEAFRIYSEEIEYSTENTDEIIFGITEEII